jgi:hypothetical protein
VDMSPLARHCATLRSQCTAEGIRLPSLPRGTRARLAWASDAREALASHFEVLDLAYERRAWDDPVWRDYL